MRRWHVAGLIVLTALWSTACGSEVTVDEEDVETTFTLRTIGGEAFAMGGTWIESCDNNGPDSTMGELTFNGFSGNSRRYLWSGFNNCTGIAPTLQYDDNFALQVTGTAGKSWDGATPAGLPATVTVTTFLVLQNGMAEGQMGFVNDTVSPPQAYFGSEPSGFDGSGYPNLLGILPNTRSP